MTGGGLPRGRTLLLEGGAGTGKTVLALQTLVNGARLEGEPGVFVSFEEQSRRIQANAAGFGWDLDDLQRRHLFFLDAQPTLDILQSGTFDLGGLLAALDAKIHEIDARRIVFDSLDVVLALLPNALDVRREAYRLHDWLLARELTGIITAKQETSGHLPVAGSLEFLHFMVDAAAALRHEVVQGISQRSLRVIKYRGSSFDENDAPFTIADRGLSIAYVPESESSPDAVSHQRVSSGVPRLDAMLEGGYLRGASVLVTGAPGTAKTTLCGTFLEAACQRGERAMMVSFDSSAAEIVRNLQSVNIDLATPIEQGHLRIESARAITASSEIHFMRIKDWAEVHEARCLAVDPASALGKSGNAQLAHGVVGRLVDWAKSRGITLLCTSLVDATHAAQEGTALQISTIADAWIHLEYLAHSGERNRGLSIIKSRGTAHSNQVREMILSHEGVTLADVYTAGGQVLMGSLRLEREREEQQARRRAESAAAESLRALEDEAAELEQRMHGVETALSRKRNEIAALRDHQQQADQAAVTTDQLMRRKRQADDNHNAD